MAPVIGSIVGSALGKTMLANTFLGAFGGKVLGSAIGSGLGSSMSGGSFSQGFKGGAIGGLVGGAVGQIPGLSALGGAAPYVQNALASGITSKATGGNFLKGALLGAGATGLQSMMTPSGMSTGQGEQTAAPIEDRSFSPGGESNAMPTMTSSANALRPDQGIGLKASDSLSGMGSVPSNPTQPIYGQGGVTPSVGANMPALKMSQGFDQTPIGFNFNQVGKNNMYRAPIEDKSVNPNGTQVNTREAGLYTDSTPFGKIMTQLGMAPTYQSIVDAGNKGIFGNTSSLQVIGSLASSLLKSGALDQASDQADPFGGERAAYLQKLRELEADPSLIYSSPDYQAAFDQGMKMLQRGYAARGMADSGGYGIALQKYGQNLASARLDQERNRLATLAGGGISPSQAAGYTAQKGQSQSDELADLLAALGSQNVMYR